MDRPFCIALFPGAFRPPHRAHFEAVKSLAQRPDVDEVVIIITNRNRQVPGTNFALAPEVALKIWSLYLQGMPKARVELAPQSAVKQALSYFERVNANTRLIFCAGENELGEDGGRFKKVRALSNRFGIPAEIIPSQSPPLAGGATGVRAHLPLGEPGRLAFMAALPKHLSDHQRRQVWQICRNAMQPMGELARQRIVTIFKKNALGEIVSIDSAKPGKTDEVMRVRLKNGRQCYIKTAHDTPKAARWDDPKGLKPRKRVYAEKKALKWLARQPWVNIERPKVIHFHNPTRTLVLSDVCPLGNTLQYQLEQGCFSKKAIAQAAAFLGRCHTADSVPAFWGSDEADCFHWRLQLKLWAESLRSLPFPERIKSRLEILHQESLASASNGFFHLDLCPKNIRVNSETVGIIDFERCGGIGDPAFELGKLLGQVWFFAAMNARDPTVTSITQTALVVYKNETKRIWDRINPRIYPFMGLEILRLTAIPPPRAFTGELKHRLTSIAQKLLKNHPQNTV